MGISCTSIMSCHMSPRMRRVVDEQSRSRRKILNCLSTFLIKLSTMRQHKQRVSLTLSSDILPNRSLLATIFCPTLFKSLPSLFKSAAGRTRPTYQTLVDSSGAARSLRRWERNSAAARKERSSLLPSLDLTIAFHHDILSYVCLQGA